MNLAALIAQFRVDADDGVEDYFWSDAQVKGWLNEAVSEAAIRARLLHESVNSAICQITVAAGTSVYPLHAALYEIDHIAFKPTGQTRSQPLHLISREELDIAEPDWRDMAGEVRYAVQGDKSIRLALTPSTTGVLYIEGYRLPLADMALDADTPEINAAHHGKLVHWALHRAFSKPDSETIDPTRAGLAETEFTRYFGIRPDADLRRATRQDATHHNPAFWV